jgi:hypothetical protein
MKNFTLRLSADLSPRLSLIFFKSILIFCLFFMMVPVFPLLAEETGETIEQEAGFYYTVKKGDTLWDLSERFGDSPWLWPDLWKENTQIPNPHWIYPGNRIRLFRKEWVQTIEKEAVQPVAQPEPVYFAFKDIDMVGFIRKEPVKPSAVIFKVKENVKMISTGDLVYLRKEAGAEFVPGSRYTAYRTLEPIKDEKTREFIGIQHYITGIVEVVKEEPQFVVAKIVQSFRPIYVADKVMPYTRRISRIPLIKSTEGILGNIISSEENQQIFGDHTVAFIDKGINDGIKVGQVYQLFYQDEAIVNPKSKERVLLTPTDAGNILVLHTEETTSTVIVTNAKDPLEPGAKIRSFIE